MNRGEMKFLAYGAPLSARSVGTRFLISRYTEGLTPTLIGGLNFFVSTHLQRVLI